MPRMDAKTIVKMWPSAVVLGEELGQKPDTVRKWAIRGSIPAEVWLPLTKAAQARGYPVTLELLAEIAAA